MSIDKAPDMGKAWQNPPSKAHEQDNYSDARAWLQSRIKAPEPEPIPERPVLISELDTLLKMRRQLDQPKPELNYDLAQETTSRDKSAALKSLDKQIEATGKPFEKWSNHHTLDTFNQRADDFDYSER